MNGKVAIDDVFAGKYYHHAVIMIEIIIIFAIIIIIGFYMIFMAENSVLEVIINTIAPNDLSRNWLAEGGWK